MNQQKMQKLNQLFNQFAQEEQASSFAVHNLLNRTIQIVNQQVKKQEKEDEKEG